MAYFVDSASAVGAPGEVHTTKLNELGSERKASDGYTYIYLAGATSLAANEWVSYVPGVWTAVRLVPAAKGSVAIATAAVASATNYGWFLIIGSQTAVCESSIVSNANVYIKAAGTGRVDGVIVKNDQVKNAKTTTAGVAAGTATVAINRPFVGSNDESV